MTTEFNAGEHDQVTRSIQIRWSDMDANHHLRHSAYYDYGAAMRMMVLSDRGLTMGKLEELQIGPILFREEAIFKREIRMDDTLKLDVCVVRATADFSRWSLRHQFIKGDGSIAAILNIDGAWMDLTRRKLAVPPAFVQEVFNGFPKAPEYALIVRDPK